MILVFGTIFFLGLFLVLLIFESRKQTIVYVYEDKPKYDYEAVKYGAYQRAIAGDRAAREWCEDNIFNKPIPQKIEKPKIPVAPSKAVAPIINKPAPKEDPYNHQVVQDSISALVNLGMKKNEARQKVMSIYSCSNNTVESIVKSAFRR